MEGTREILLAWLQLRSLAVSSWDSGPCCPQGRALPYSSISSAPSAGLAPRRGSVNVMEHIG